MKEIQLTQGKIALVDDEDYEWLNQWKWLAHKARGKFYAKRNIWINNKRVLVGMHRVIMNTPIHLEVDHVDHNTLNNQRYNLRNCSHCQNSKNQKSHKDSTSKYKGVFQKRPDRFQSHITQNGKIIHLGTYKTEEEAARAYDEAAKRLHGKFAYLNFKKTG